MSNEDNVLNGYAGCIGALMVAHILRALLDCDVGTLWHMWRLMLSKDLLLVEMLGSNLLCQ